MRGYETVWNSEYLAQSGLQNYSWITTILHVQICKQTFESIKLCLSIRCAGFSSFKWFCLLCSEKKLCDEMMKESNERVCHT